LKYKLDRLKKLITHEIMRIITEKYLKDPRIPEFMSITNITLSKDLHYCHLYFSMINDDENAINNALTGLNNAKGFIQKLIGERLQLKFTPKIEFRYDHTQNKAYNVDKIINNIIDERHTTEE